MKPILLYCLCICLVGCRGKTRVINPIVIDTNIHRYKQATIEMPDSIEITFANKRTLKLPLPIKNYDTGIMRKMYKVASFPEKPDSMQFVTDRIVKYKTFK